MVVVKMMPSETEWEDDESLALVGRNRRMRLCIAPVTIAIAGAIVVAVGARTLEAVDAQRVALREELRALQANQEITLAYARALSDELNVTRATAAHTMAALRAIRKLVPLRHDDGGIDCTAMRTRGWNPLQAHFAGCTPDDMFQSGFFRNELDPMTHVTTYVNIPNGLSELNWTAAEMHRAGYSLNVTARYFTPLMFKRSGLSLHDACMVNKPGTFRIRDVRSDCADLARSWHFDDELGLKQFETYGRPYGPFHFRTSWEA